MRSSTACLLLLLLVGCNAAEIRDEAASAIVTLTDEEKALAQETVRTIGELIDLRDSIYGELANIAGMTDDEVVQQALEEAAERMAHGLTERLKRLAMRLQAHSRVLQEVIRQLHRIHQLAVDQISLMALLNAPLSFFGVKPFDQGGGSSTPTTPPTPSGPGFPIGETIATVVAGYLTYKGGKAGWNKIKAKREDKRKEAEREKARDAAFLAMMQHMRATAPESSGGTEEGRAPPSADEFDALMKRMAAADRDPALSSADLDSPFAPRNGGNN